MDRLEFGASTGPGRIGFMRNLSRRADGSSFYINLRVTGQYAASCQEAQSAGWRLRPDHEGAPPNQRNFAPNMEAASIFLGTLANPESNRVAIAGRKLLIFVRHFVFAVSRANRAATRARPHFTFARLSPGSSSSGSFGSPDLREPLLRHIAVRGMSRGPSTGSFDPVCATGSSRGRIELYAKIRGRLDQIVGIVATMKTAQPANIADCRARRVSAQYPPAPPRHAIVWRRSSLLGHVRGIAETATGR